jgi:diguanylate cyclase (GGDEF)-like protein
MRRGRRGHKPAEAKPGDNDLLRVGLAIDRALKADGGASLLLVDLDNLMVLNQEAGRAVGDKAINLTTKVLAFTAKVEGWTFGRVGGDEFALLAPGVPLEAAFLRAARLREELATQLRKAIPGRHKVTATIGVANAPRDAKSAEQLRRKADLALYAAKEQGGNAVGLPPGEDMVLKSSYYSSAQLGRLRALAERAKKKEAVLLREALDDLLRKHERT